MNVKLSIILYILFTKPLLFNIYFDHKLNWTQHIAHVRNKISKGIGIMYRARNYLTKNSLKSL